MKEIMETISNYLSGDDQDIIRDLIFMEFDKSLKGYFVDSVEINVGNKTKVDFLG